MKEEITVELTNYCPHECKFCSSDGTKVREEATFITPQQVSDLLGDKIYEHIIISGGEPLSHPQFWEILQIIKQHTEDPILYSNAIPHLIYNPHVLDGVYLEANITVTPETDKVHILRRVKQGREANRPEVRVSSNDPDKCVICDHRVIRCDGTIGKAPCDKWATVEEDRNETK